MRLATISDGRICVYEIDHAADSLDLNPKIAGSARKRFLASASEIVRKFSDGIDPRYFQLLMAGELTPTICATAAVPPNASTMSSTELSMRHDSSPLVNLSRVHTLGMDSRAVARPNNAMDSKKLIGERLEIWLLAKGITAAQLCDSIECKANEWSQFQSGKRKISMRVAHELVHNYGLTLDWIYRGVAAGEIPTELLGKMKQIKNARTAASAAGENASVRRKKKIHKM